VPRVARRACRLRLAYVRRLQSEQKRIFDVPAILAACVHTGLDISLDIAGAGPEEEGLLAANVGDRVTFLDALDEAALREPVYRRSDVRLLTSLMGNWRNRCLGSISEGMALLSSDYLGRRAEGSHAP
jgi:glycosyltransferase involved in cell wall biosynthesis